eukprot:403358959
MRKLVFELLQPTVQRSHEDREILYNARKQVQSHQQRIEELEYSFFKSDKKTTIFDQIYMKMGEMEQDRKSDQAKTDHHLNGFLSRIDDIKFMCQNLQTVQDQQDSSNSQFRNQLESINQHISETKETFIKQLSQDTSKINKKIEEVNSIVQNSRVMIDSQQQTQLTYQNRLDSFKTLLDQYKSEYEQLQLDIQNFNTQKLEIVDFEAKHQDILDNFKRIQKLLDIKDNQVQTIENFIEKYVPIRVQSQISEILNEVMSGKQLELLEEVEKKKFDELHQVLLLDSGVANLLQQIKSMNADLGHIEEEEIEDEEYQDDAVGQGTNLQISEDQESQVSNIRPANIDIQISTLTQKSNLSAASKRMSKLQNAQSMQNERRRLSTMNFMQQQIAMFHLQNQQQNSNSHNSEDGQISQNQNKLLSPKDKTIFTNIANPVLTRGIISMDDFELIKNKVDSMMPDQLEVKIQNESKQLNELIQRDVKENKEYISTLHSEIESISKKIKKETREVLKQIVDENLKNQDFKDLKSKMEISTESLAKIISCLVEFISMQFESQKQQSVSQAPVHKILVSQIAEQSETQNKSEVSTHHDDISHSKKVNFIMSTERSQLNSNQGIGALQQLNKNNAEKSYSFDFRSVPTTAQQTSRNMGQSNVVPGTSSRYQRLPNLGGVGRSINQKISDMKGFFEDSTTIKSFDKSHKKMGQTNNARLSQSFHHDFSGVGSASPSRQVRNQNTSPNQSIKYRGKSLDSVNIEIMQQTLLKKCQEIISTNFYPFKDKNLTTQKIFQDLYEYIYVHQRNKTTDNQNENKIITTSEVPDFFSTQQDFNNVKNSKFALQQKVNVNTSLSLIDSQTNMNDIQSMNSLEKRNLDESPSTHNNTIHNQMTAKNNYAQSNSLTSRSNLESQALQKRNRSLIKTSDQRALAIEKLNQNIGRSSRDSQTRIK